MAQVALNADLIPPQGPAIKKEKMTAKTLDLQKNINESRRRFLKAGGLMGATAIISGSLGLTAFGRGQQGEVHLGSGIGHPIPKSVQKDPLYNISMAMFQRAAGGPFGFWLNGSKLMDATLVIVKDLTPAGFNGGVASPKQAFELDFEGPEAMPLAQGTYQLYGGNLPVFQLFVVPELPTSRGITYVAIVNRLYP